MGGMGGMGGMMLAVGAVFVKFPKTFDSSTYWAVAQTFMEFGCYEDQSS
jgi:hypothetical protein